MSPLFNDCDSDIVNFIREEINSRKVVIFSKTYCSFSKKAKSVFHDCDHIYYAVELDLRKDGFEILHALEKITGEGHTPFVFLKGEYLGGGAKDFLEIHESDKIRILLDVPPRPIYPLNRVYERTKEYIKKKYLTDDLSKPVMYPETQKKIYSGPPKREDMAAFTTPNMPKYVTYFLNHFFREKDIVETQEFKIPQESSGYWMV